MQHLARFDRRLQARRCAADAGAAAAPAAPDAPVDPATAARATQATAKLRALVKFMGAGAMAAKIEAEDRVDVPSQAELEALGPVEAMARLRGAERALMTKLGAVSESVADRMEAKAKCGPCSRFPHADCSWRRCRLHGRPYVSTRIRLNVHGTRRHDSAAVGMCGC